MTDPAAELDRVGDERMKRAAYASLWDYADTLNQNGGLIYGHP